MVIHNSRTDNGSKYTGGVRTLVVCPSCPLSAYKPGLSITGRRPSCGMRAPAPGATLRSKLSITCKPDKKHTPENG
ncbi:hypothetical protein HF086_016342 [Spodoptera exigua]|uniref:Uncharacterized protein n=1 Tax=Spodoptera exigua TaxID=7107 RepID=A0A922MRQ4_SPOEX|nr:hypothetical protein HF086_016342 [Spodoptera exigua]